MEIRKKRSSKQVCLWSFPYFDGLSSNSSLSGKSRHPIHLTSRSEGHLSSVIPANDTRGSVSGHRNFLHRERGSSLGPLAPEASA